MTGSGSRRSSLITVATSLGDETLATVLGAVLFTLGAWPLLLTEHLPLQDLPNHLATAEVILHPDLYPDFAFNGFIKTNVVLAAWLVFVGRAIGLPLAAKIFTAGTLAATAFTLPRFILRFGGRARMITGSAFGWPFVHHWFVAMGMLNFALGIPIAMLLLIELRVQSMQPSFVRVVRASLAAVLLWCAHVFVLGIVGLLVIVHAMTRTAWKERANQAARLFVPLVPAGLLIVASVLERMATPAESNVTEYGAAFHPPLDLAYNFWAEFYGVFSPASVPSAVASVALAWFAWTRRKEAPLFFGSVALGLLAAGFFILPYNAMNWAYLSARFLPFLYLGALLRVPDTIPRPALVAMSACAVAYSAGLGLDYVRLDQERALFVEGVPEIPRGARLLPLMFEARVPGGNTWSLRHAWGYYLLAKHTSAPMLFADSRSYPITGRQAPPEVIRRALEAERRGNVEAFCRHLRSDGVHSVDCAAAWSSEWASFWEEVAAHFDHIILWRPSAAVLATIPPSLFVTLRTGPLTVVRLAALPATKETLRP
jgi:hypothetical protein